jgi:hypothetical protein
MSYNSQIKSYSINYDGYNYTDKDVVTSSISSYGDITITATVTDARGRTSYAASKTVNVCAYTKPKIESLSVGRCNADGSDNDRGEYVKVRFSGQLTNINSRNTTQCIVKYKKTQDSEYTTVKLDQYKNAYSITNASYIFAADTGCAYDVSLLLEDGVSSVSKITSVSTAFVLMDWKGSGRGIAIGKMSELNDVFENDLELHQRQHIQMSNYTQIRGVAPDGTVKNAFQAQNENGNTVVGYGNYDNKIGNTNIYGYDVMFGVSITPTPVTYRPYLRWGDIQVRQIKTSGYVTNGGKDVSFFLPMAVPTIGSPIVSISSGNGFVLRQGGKYTHGSSADTYVTPSYYNAVADRHGVRITATFSDTTNVINNDSIGIYWDGDVYYTQ